MSFDITYVVDGSPVTETFHMSNTPEWNASGWNTDNQNEAWNSDNTSGLYMSFRYDYTPTRLHIWWSDNQLSTEITNIAIAHDTIDTEIIHKIDAKYLDKLEIRSSYPKLHGESNSYANLGFDTAGRLSILFNSARTDIDLDTYEGLSARINKDARTFVLNESDDSLISPIKLKPLVSGISSDTPTHEESGYTIIDKPLNYDVYRRTLELYEDGNYAYIKYYGKNGVGTWNSFTVVKRGDAFGRDGDDVRIIEKDNNAYFAVRVGSWYLDTIKDSPEWYIVKSDVIDTTCIPVDGETIIVEDNKLKAVGGGGGGGTPENMVTTDTAQAITANKVFYSGITIAQTGNKPAHKIVGDSSTKLEQYTHTLPIKNGTFAMMSDIPDVSGLATKAELEARTPRTRAYEINGLNELQQYFTDIHPNITGAYGEIIIQECNTSNRRSMMSMAIKLLFDHAETLPAGTALMTASPDLFTHRMMCFGEATCANTSIVTPTNQTRVAIGLNNATLYLSGALTPTYKVVNICSNFSVVMPEDSPSLR